MLLQNVDQLTFSKLGWSAILYSGGSRIEEREVLSGMGALARREFLKTTPNFGQNLAYFCVESAEG